MKAGLVSMCDLLAGSVVARAADLAIAVVGPMTGPNGSIGEPMRHGAELAAEATSRAACSARRSRSRSDVA